MPRDSRGRTVLPDRARPKHVQRMLDMIKKQGDYYDDYPKHYMLPEHGQEYALLEYVAGLERDRELVAEWWVVTWESPLQTAHESFNTREDAWVHVKQLRDSGCAATVKHCRRYSMAKASRP